MKGTFRIAGESSFQKFAEFESFDFWGDFGGDFQGDFQGDFAEFFESFFEGVIAHSESKTILVKNIKKVEATL